MTKTTKPAKRSRAKLPAAKTDIVITRHKFGGRVWSCPDCGFDNDGMLLRCFNCPKVVELPGGPDTPLDGIAINEHGVVIHGETSITIPVGKKHVAEIEFAEVQPGRFHLGYNFEAKGNAGSSSSTSVVGKAFTSESEAVLEGIDRAEEFFSNDPDVMQAIEKWTKTNLKKYWKVPRLKGLPNGKAAWQCRICESFNDANEKDCLRCHSYPTKIEIETKEIALDRIEPNQLNPRVQLTGIEELAESLKEHGQLVEAIGHYYGGEFPGDTDSSNKRMVRLIAGHRRLAAAKLAGLQTLRVRILFVTEKESLELMGRDNEERENFDAISRATWYQSMLDMHGISQRELATKLNKSQPDIANHLRLLQLPEEWRQKVIDGEISMTMARDLAAYVDNPEVMAGARAFLKIHDRESISTRAWAEALKRLASSDNPDDEKPAESEDAEEAGSEPKPAKEPSDKARSPGIESYRWGWFALQLQDIVANEIDGLSVKALESMVREGHRSIAKDWTPEREFFEALTHTELVGIVRRDWADRISDELKESALEMDFEDLIEDLMSLDVPLPTPDILK